MHTATGLINGTPMALIDWDTAITALNGTRLPCSGSEGRILRLAASLAHAIPVDLQIAPSKTDTERLLVGGPKLADVLSAIIRRIRRPDGTVPFVRARDSHELLWMPPTPLLFQRRVGTENQSSAAHP